MAKRELIPAKQEKARERLKNFRAELSDYQETFQRLKGSHEENVQALSSPFHPPPIRETHPSGRRVASPGLIVLIRGTDLSLTVTSNKQSILKIVTNSSHAALTTQQPPKTRIATLNHNLPNPYRPIRLFTLHLQITLMPPTISPLAPRPRNILERPTLFANNPSWHKRMHNWMSI